MQAISRLKQNSTKKRILAVSHYYVTDNRGGGEVMLHEILRRFVQEGWDVDAVAIDNTTASETLDGVNVFKGSRHLNMISKKYDLIVTQFWQANEVLKKAQALNIPTMYIVHNNMAPTQKTLAEFRVDLCVFNTEWIQNFFHYTKSNSIVVHPPVYTEKHATKSGENITLVNLIPSKGAYCFYNMAERFLNQPFLGVKGGYYLNQQICLQRKNVKIIANTDNMKDDVWANTKILLMPSEYESYGMVGVEALASGIPVIANDTPGLRESLGYAGIFPKAFTIRDWQIAIQNLLDPVEYDKASKLALKRAAEIQPQKELDALVERVKEII